MAEERDYEHILTQLYTRKLTRKVFDQIRGDFKAKTDKDLCNIVEEAHSEIIKDIINTPTGRKGADVRTKLFKLVDYSTYLRFCKIKK